MYYSYISNKVNAPITFTEREREMIVGLTQVIFHVLGCWMCFKFDILVIFELRNIIIKYKNASIFQTKSAYIEFENDSVSIYVNFPKIKISS